ncbi:MAG: ribbon-helix-helix protein, CopG family [Thermoleophilia bacterium]
MLVSIPDELLARIDRTARARGTTRSDLIQRLATDHLPDDEQARRARLERLLATPVDRGGDSADAVRSDRRR